MMESVRASITLQGTATDALAFIRSMEMFSNTKKADVCWIIIQETIMSSAGPSVWMSLSRQCSESMGMESLVQSQEPSPSHTAEAMDSATIPCHHCISVLVSVIHILYFICLKPIKTFRDHSTVHSIIFPSTQKYLIKIDPSLLCSMGWNVTMSVCDMNHVFIWCLPFYLKCQGGSQLTSPATSYLMIRCLKAHSRRGGKFKLGELSLSCVKIKFRYPLFNIPSCNIGSSIRSPLRLFQAFLDCMLWKYYWSNQNNVFKQNEP